jgi:nucleoside-diphosphate-sugar epimerase
MRVLVTGAAGFVGQVLCASLTQRGYVLRAALRKDRTAPACVAEQAVVGDISAPVDWRAALSDVDAVMHLAARAHVLGDSPANSQLYLDVNAHATRRLAEAAARSGVRRFIYVSSIKVNGEEAPGRTFAPTDVPNPQDAYGTSKLLAERAVLEVSARTGMQATIVRPPLVYGPGVRGNFLRLMRWVDRGWPLPLGSIHNRRSLVSIWNLCDLLERLLSDPLASGRTWLVSDSEDLSTPDLIRRIGVAMGRNVRLLPIPMRVLQGAAQMAGKQAEFARLCGSLSVDISATRNELGWAPAVSMDEALARTARWYFSGIGSHGA